MELKEYIKKNYGKETAKQIAEKFGTNIYKIYREASNLGVKTNKAQNKTLILN